MVKEVPTGKNIILTDVLELNIIEIPKAREMLKREPDNKLAQWIIFLDNPNESEVSKFMKEDKEIKEAVEKLEEISEDEELRRLAELKEKAEIDDKLARMYLTKYGREEGIKEGIKQGKKEGINSEKIEVAKRMKDKGMDIELIAEITKLTKEEIDNI